MKEIKKIILVYSHIPGFATTNRMLCFAKGYKAAGLEVEIICLGLRGAVPFTLDGIEVRFIGEDDGLNILLSRLKSERALLKAIKQDYRPSDTVIVTRSSLWAFCLNRKKYHFFLDRGEVPFYSNSKSIKYLMEEWLGRRLTKRATGLLAQTHTLKEYYTNYGVKYVDVNNMFVDVSRFDGLSKSTEEKYIGYCGQVSIHKDGVDDLIKAFKMVHDKYQDWKLKIMGCCLIKDDEKELNRLVHELGIETSVEFSGLVDASKMPNLLYQASILALARPQSDQAKYGFPTKVGEYLCTGNPSVLTRVGELGRYMQDRVHCVFANPDDPKDFAQQLMWVIEHPAESARIAKKGKELVNTDFSMFVQSRRALDFMQQTINK